jgi:hypothetical protein
VDGKLGDDGLSRAGGGGNENTLPLLDALARFDLKRIQIKVSRNPEFFDDLRLVIFEADGKCDYTAVREGLWARGMRELQSGFHNVWEKREWR